MSRGWLAPSVDEALVRELARKLGVRRLTAQVLAGRGKHDPDGASRFLSPRLGDLRPPVAIADLDRAIDRLARAAVAHERVGVFGDYDVDGVTTAAVLAVGLRTLGADVVVRVANRAAGYGLRPAEALRFADDGCKVLVTGDCGTSDHEALALVRDRGVDTVVIDHHQVPEGISPAHALINPHRHDDAFPFKGLASCGLAFYLVAALRSRLRAHGHAAATSWDTRELLDLVALGTIADMVPLVDENRILASSGLRELAGRRRPGVRALLALTEHAVGEPVVSADVAFRLAPRLNAAGRLGEAKLALDVLLAPNDDEARARAAELDGRNRERQKVQEDVWGEASAAAEAQLGAPAIVVGGEGWHPGVVGIVAAKLVERFARPAIVVGFAGAVGRGSARTVRGFDLYRALVACRAHLVAYGGHAAAAGLTVSLEAFPAFVSAFHDVAGAELGRTRPSGALDVDAAVDLADLDLGQIDELARLGPFGAANGEPLLVLPRVTAAHARVVGKGHLQLTLKRGGAVADAIGFGMAADAPPEGSELDVVACAEVDTFRGSRRARLRLKHLLPVTT